MQFEIASLGINKGHLSWATVSSFISTCIVRNMSLFNDFSPIIDTSQCHIFHYRIKMFVFIPAPHTKYRISLRAFTKKREGPASDTLVVTTDSVPPGAPVLTNISCSEGTGDKITGDHIKVEWRRPRNSRDKIAYYELRLRPSNNVNGGGGGDRRLKVDVVNDTFKHVAYLSNLTSDAAYDLTLTAFVESAVNAGSFYRGPSSHARKVYVGKRCDPLQAFSKVPGYVLLEYNAGITAGVVGTISLLAFIVLLLLVCRFDIENLFN